MKKHKDMVMKNNQEVTMINRSTLNLWKHLIQCIKLRDLDLQVRWFDPWCGHNKICTAVGPSSKALNPTLLRGGGGCLLLSYLV